MTNKCYKVGTYSLVLYCLANGTLLMVSSSDLISVDNIVVPKLQRYLLLCLRPINQAVYNPSSAFIYFILVDQCLKVATDLCLNQCFVFWF